MNLNAILCMFIVILASCSSFSMQVLFDNHTYTVVDQGRSHKVKECDPDSLLRKMNTHSLRQFIHDGGRIRASKLDNGDYIVRAYVPGKGGAPLCRLRELLSVAAIGSIATVGTTLVIGPAAGLVMGCIILSACGSIATGLSIDINGNEEEL